MVGYPKYPTGGRILDKDALDRNGVVVFDVMIMIGGTNAIRRIGAVWTVRVGWKGRFLAWIWFGICR